MKLRAALAEQKPLEPDIAKIVNDNLWNLYAEEPEQEPVACSHRDEPRGCYRVRCQLGRKCVEPLYAHPPRNQEQTIMKYSNIDKSAFRKGEYVGYACGLVFHIARCHCGWSAWADSTARFTAPTLRDVSLRLENFILAVRPSHLAPTRGATTNQELAHTPGPWLYARVDDTTEEIVTDEGDSVCDVCRASAADLSLIANAPALLAALRSLADYFGPDVDNGLDERLTTARAAIARATYTPEAAAAIRERSKE